MKPAPMDDAFVLLRFGALVADPRTCPAGNHSFGHWSLSPVPVGAGNAVCSCVELSPAGAMREHSVKCPLCKRPTLNFSGRCNEHREDAQ